MAELTGSCLRTLRASPNWECQYYTGSFGFTGSEVTSGILTGFSEVDGSMTAFRVSGMNVPAPTAYSLVNSNDLPTLFSLALANSDVITGSASNDVIRAFGGNDTVFSGGGTDRIFAGAGNDWVALTSVSGNTVDGESGIDTVGYGGARSFYTLSLSGLNASVTQSGRQDFLANVERIAFADQIVALDTAGDAGQGFRLYQAAFNRTPDKSGLSFWVHALDTGTSLHDVAVGFVNSAEFKAVYGAGVSNPQIVEKLYHNVLGRPGEQGGTDYWIGRLQSGTSVVDVLANFSESPENVAKVAPLIGTGISLEPGFFA